MTTLSKKSFLLSAALIFTGCFLLYGNTLGHGFVWDDYAEVVGNDVFHHASNLGKFFTVPYWYLATGGFSPYHRPMIPIMILAVSTFFGKNPFGYHLFNLLVHSFTCWIYFVYLNRLKISRWVQIAAAAIFIFHPIHVEAVAWGSARPVLFGSLCFILCAWISSYLSEAHSSAQKTGLYALLFACFSIGLLTYHSILTYPILIFFSDFVKPDGNSKDLKTRLMEYGGYFILAAGWMAYCLYLFHQMGEWDLRPFYSASRANVFYTGAPLEWFLTPINTLTRYSELLLFPLILVPDVLFKASVLSLSAVGAFLLMAVISAGVFKTTPYRRPFLLSIIWMVVTLLTVANLAPSGGLFADRYLYLPSMGFALWAGIVLDALKQFLETRSPKGGRITAGFLAAILLLYAARTVTQNQIWKNDFTFWLEASIASPHKGRPHNKLGILMENSGHFKEAAEEYQKVLELDPDEYLMTYKRMAETLKKLGKAEEAKPYEEEFNLRVQEIKKKQAENPGKKNETLFTVNN